jgi:indolepyruvate ferredoxin oxidoreductase alpha subunit
MVPVFEPSNQQEAYDMVSDAFELSERLKEPVVLRVVTRLAHSRAAVAVGAQKDEKPLSPACESWVLLPGIARRKYVELLDKQPDMLKAAEESKYNRVERANDFRLGVVACGIAYNYVKEAVGSDANIVKVSQYPLPEDKIRALARECDSIIVVEDGQPVVEEIIKGLLGAGYPVKGRLTGDLPRTGELTPDNVAAALGKPTGSAFDNAKNLAGRPPQLCQGCGHRDVYAALNQVLAEYPDYRIFGDIGCYTLGALPPFKALASCVDMGASITMAKGAADAGLFPAVAIIGDSTFTHSGMTGLLDAVNDKSNITVVISDNLTTGMTGGQDSAGTNKYEAICLGLGVEPEHVRVVVPLPKNMAEITRILKEEIEYNGVSVIIPRRECMQTLQRHLREAKKAKEASK